MGAVSAIQKLMPRLSDSAFECKSFRIVETSVMPHFSDAARLRLFDQPQNPKPISANGLVSIANSYFMHS
jgi:hypothetical protein